MQKVEEAPIDTVEPQWEYVPKAGGSIAGDLTPSLPQPQNCTIPGAELEMKH